MKKRIEFLPSTLEERKKFYEKELSIKKFKQWLKKNNLPIPQICAIDAGTETKITLKKEWKNTLFYFPFSELKEKIKKYCPEDVYYDRNQYKNPEKVLKTLNFNSWIAQELVFDIDADNLPGCECKNNQKVCYRCLKIAYKSALNMKLFLQRKGFKKIGIVYSGRGFHIHVFDKNAFRLTIKKREKLNKELADFPIDEWVSRGYIKLIRMPYTLNGLVSKECLPIDRELSLIKTFQLTNTK